MRKPGSSLAPAGIEGLERARAGGLKSYAPHALVVFFLLVLAGAWERNDLDFTKAYYPAARSILETGTFGYHHDGAKNLPIILLLMTPFAAGDPKSGTELLLAVNLAAYAAAFGIAANGFARSPRDVWVLAFLFVSSTPLRTSVELGQTTPVALLLIVAALALYQKGSRAGAGALAAGGFLLKIPAGAVGLILVRKSHWRGVAAAAATVGGMTAASVLLFGWNLHQEFWNWVMAKNAGTTLVAYNNQNVFAFLMRYQVFRMRDWAAVPIPPLLYGAILAGVAAWTAYLYGRLLAAREGTAESMRREWSLLIGTGLAVFPVSWDHYYLLLILPFYSLYEQWKEKPDRWVWAAGAASFVAVNLPAEVLMWPGWRIRALRITMVGLPFLGCVLLLGALTWAVASRGSPGVRSSDG